MILDTCGPTLLILRDLVGRPADVAQMLTEQHWPGVREAVPAFESVGLHIDPLSFDRTDLEAWLASTVTAPVRASRLIRVPVCYELGLDLASVTALTGLITDEVIAEHGGSTYECAAIGFCPGFPYLRGLPSSLAGLSRLESPRTRVPRGSVGITGDQCGIYPAAVPGGWNLIGVTPLTVADPHQDFFPILPGDQVVFDRIDEGLFRRLEGARLGEVC